MRKKLKSLDNLQAIGYNVCNYGDLIFPRER
jgi:hypothetical protein